MIAIPNTIGDRHSAFRAARTLLDASEDAPHVLLIDRDGVAGPALSVLLTPEAQVTQVSSVAQAVMTLRRQSFAAAVIDPRHIEGDIGELLELLMDCPVICYSAVEPSWRDFADVMLPTPWTAPRKLWSSVARMLGMPSPVFAGA